MCSNISAFGKTTLACFSCCISLHTVRHFYMLPKPNEFPVCWPSECECNENIIIIASVIFFVMRLLTIRLLAHCVLSAETLFLSGFTDDPNEKHLCALATFHISPTSTGCIYSLVYRCNQPKCFGSY